MIHAIRLNSVFRDGQENGILAWDCVQSDYVVLIPSVLALLGDNPMQSEFCCHIGLNGKYFCRICFVKGQETNMDDTTGVKRKETKEELIARVKEFLHVSC